MARRKHRTVKVYAVDWLDASGDTAWASKTVASKREPALCTTVGVIISRTKRKIVIAGTVGHGGDEEVGDVNVIPGNMLKSVSLLGEILIHDAHG